MSGINFWAVLVSAVGAFVVSSVWYTIFGTEMARLLGTASAAEPDRPGPAKIAVELTRSIVVGLVIAGLTVRLDLDGAGASILLGLVLWLGFPFVLLTGSVQWDRVPWRLAAIHAGDWLLKLLLVAVVIGVWR